MEDNMNISYKAIFEEQPDGGFSVSVPALPGCISEGDTFEDAKNNIEEAILGYLEALKKDGEEFPKEVPSILINQINTSISL